MEGQYIILKKISSYMEDQRYSYEEASVWFFCRGQIAPRI